MICAEILRDHDGEAGMAGIILLSEHNERIKIAVTPTITFLCFSLIC
jgi:hypothetical protein